MGIISLVLGDPKLEPFGTCKILWEALKLPTKKRSTLPFILLLSLLSSSLLFFANHLSICPFLTDLSINLSVMGTVDPKSLEFTELLSATKNSITNLTITEVIFIIVYFFVSSFLYIATVHASAMTYINRVHSSTLEELFARIRRTWKGAVVTQLYIAFLSFVCGTLMLLVFIAVFFLVADDYSVFAIITGIAVGLVVLYLYLHLTALWLLGAVVSMVEDGCYGVEALEMGMELTEGRKRQGIVISLLMATANWSIYGAYSFNSTLFVPRLIASNPMANGFLMVNLGMVLNMIAISAYTVLYYECKKSHGEEIPMRGGFVCTSLPSTSHIHEGFP